MFRPANLLFLFAILKIRYIKCEFEGRVVDGTYAKIEDFPHSVYLHVNCAATGSWSCGSSILNQRILLTAAHCVMNENTGKVCNVGTRNSNMDAFLGNEDLRQVRISRVISDVSMHDGFDFNTVEHDIAMVKMKDKVPLGRNLKRVIIPRSWNLKDPYGLVAGWGITNEKRPATSGTDKLIQVNQKLRSQVTCDLIGPLGVGMFCAGSTVGNDPRVAVGDSGSAFVHDKVIQIGIVSFKQPRYPALSVYTNTTYYYPWIRRNAQVLYCRRSKK